MVNKRLKKILKRALILMAGIAALGAGTSYFVLQASLPLENGEIALPGLSREATLSRDSRGIPTIDAANRTDIARVLGFVHGQERFFQMDLMRRAAAGELSELVGEKALAFDKSRRVHQFRGRSKLAWDGLTAGEKEMVKAYSEGVNAGLSNLKARPFEYVLLKAAPAPWRPEDSLLVGYGLFFELQDSTGKYDMTRGVMQETLPPEVFRFFAENGSRWEETLDGSKQEIVEVPKSELFDYLKQPAISDSLFGQEPKIEMRGSNQWAVSGSKTADGKAILACDMHLNISVPSIWFRATFRYKDGPRDVEIHGATLPGTPLMIIGSNRFVAWGFTNSFIDTTDILLIPPEKEEELIKKEADLIFVKDREPVLFENKVSPWGPVLEEKYLGNYVSLLWAAHIPEAVNMRQTVLETATSVLDVLEKSKEIRIPLLNLMAADSQGNIGWTLVGAIPKREGFDGKTPVFAQNAGENPGWQGFLDSADYPVIYNPEGGYLVTANNRVLGGNWQSIYWPNGFLNGVRANQIAKRLREKELLTEEDMLGIQLDDEALFFNRWRDLLKELLANEALAHPRKAELLEVVDCWNGRCSSDSAAYFWIRTFRGKVSEKILKRALKPCLNAWEHFNFGTFDFEEPVWLIASLRPEHLRSPEFTTWEEELFFSVKEMIDLVPLNTRLSEKTWGEQNTLAIRHPLSKAIPFSGLLLNMPEKGVSGDYWVPRVSGPTIGASERFAVAPGVEERGIFHAPVGQSGHPLSPHYGDGHKNWYEGRPESLMPGDAVSLLKFYPL